MSEIIYSKRYDQPNGWPVMPNVEISTFAQQLRHPRIGECYNNSILVLPLLKTVRPYPLRYVEGWVVMLDMIQLPFSHGWLESLTGPNDTWEVVETTLSLRPVYRYYGGVTYDPETIKPGRLFRMSSVNTPLIANHAPPMDDYLNNQHYRAAFDLAVSDSAVLLGWEKHVVELAARGLQTAADSWYGRNDK